MEFSKLSRTKTLLLITAISTTLSACSLFGPFVDRRREAGVSDISKLYVGESTPVNPAICYNSIVSSYEDVKKMADEECQKHGTGTHAEFVDKSVFTCRVLIPNHLYFKCVNDEEKK